MTDPRQLSGLELASALRDSRLRTWSLVEDLTPAQWNPPRQLGINRIAWELAHVAWFAEFWILRGPHHCDAQGMVHAARPPRFCGPDALFDSARLAHAQRWVEAMPGRAELVPMLSGQLEACIAALPAGAPAATDAAQDPLYFHRLALFHEDMHGEAFCWMRSALAYPAPHGVTVPRLPVSRALTVPGTDTCIGYRDTQAGFAFDNERPAMAVCLGHFEIDSAPISAGEFARFVEAGGYDHAPYWPHEAGVWRTNSACAHPQQWRRGPDGGWQMRWFDQWLPLDAMAPAMHLNAFEAQAYCLWAGRRLPTASEWEHAATTQPGFHWGHSVWEWTSSAFAPYPGFTPGPYHAYSQPWFGNHRELRGGAFASHDRMHHPRYRNFFQPHRTDVFAGFRTVAG
ncbi:MAG: selenoneine synthase SenA [Rhodoferax sp.]|nr:selenoneine synthase SenA [Rhodoferax sp.]MDP3650869.1 selenoneine synthase SenA [Rhodoferax sp.]